MAANHVIGVLIVRGRTVHHHIEVSALETGNYFFDVKMMEFLARAGLEIECADFNKAIHG